jgi:hypothetical protein
MSLNTHIIQTKYRTHEELLAVQSQSLSTTDGQSVSMSWYEAQSGTFDQRSFFSPLAQS